MVSTHQQAVFFAKILYITSDLVLIHYKIECISITITYPYYVIIVLIV